MYVISEFDIDDNGVRHPRFDAVVLFESDRWCVQSYSGMLNARERAAPDGCREVPPHLTTLLTAAVGWAPSIALAKGDVSRLLAPHGSYDCDIDELSTIERAGRSAPCTQQEGEVRGVHVAVAVEIGRARPARSPCRQQHREVRRVHDAVTVKVAEDGRITRRDDE